MRPNIMSNSLFPDTRMLARAVFIFLQSYFRLGSTLSFGCECNCSQDHKIRLKGQCISPQLAHGHVRVEIGQCFTPYRHYFSHITAELVKRRPSCGHLQNEELSGHESHFCPMNDCDGEKDLHLDGGACTNLVDGGSRLTWHPAERHNFIFSRP